jgi:hypothetical protein
MDLLRVFFLLRFELLSVGLELLNCRSELDVALSNGRLDARVKVT